jgi:hypothetical protein
LVVDANILVRAVLGKRVREAFETYARDVSFFVPESAYAEAEEHLATLVIKRGGDSEKAPSATTVGEYELLILPGIHNCHGQVRKITDIA